MPEEVLDGVEVLAFVGPAGTGKSQRAQLVASEHAMEFLIDDGLLIHRGQIVCGRSAKTERNQICAIRRALFQFPHHRLQVRRALAEVAPCRVMLVATSEEMACRIARRLGVPPPRSFVHIEDVASPEEIARARNERIQKKQHVIPVSSVQVRRNFAGKLVGKLRIFWSGEEPQGEKTIVRPPFTFLGKLTIEPEALVAIIREISQRTPQVASVREVRVDPQRDRLRFSITIVVSVGEMSMLDLARFLQRRLSSSVAYFTGLEVGNVNVVVSEVVL